MIKILLCSTLLCVALIAAPAKSAEKVVPAADEIAENSFQLFVVEEGLRQLGYDVTDRVSLQIQLAHVAVANGDATFYAAHAEPIHEVYWKDNGGDAKLVRLGHISSDNLQGYLIDKKTADATGIKFLEDLKDPEKAKLFDIDGNGKADLYGCDPGWGCERIVEHHLDAYGLRNTVEHKNGGYFAIIPDAIERVKEGKPTLYYTWTPLWLSGILRPGKEVEFLNVKETSLPDGQTAETTVPGLGNVGFPLIQQMIIANAEFIKRNPSAKKLFESVAIPIDDLNAENMRIYNGEKSDAQIKQHAMEWIAKHDKEWKAWISEAEAAK